MIKDVGGIVASIAAAIEEQATVTRDVAGNIAQASAGARDADQRISQTVAVSKNIARDIAGVNADISTSGRAANKCGAVRPTCPGWRMNSAPTWPNSECESDGNARCENSGSIGSGAPESNANARFVAASRTRRSKEKSTMNLKIRSQLLFAFSVVLGLMFISSAVVFWKASDVSQKLNRFKETRVPTLLISSTIDLDLMKATSDTRRVLLLVADGMTDQAGAYKQRLQEDWNLVNSAFAPLPAMSGKFVLQANKDRVSKLAAELPRLQREQIDIVDAALAAGSRHVVSVDENLAKNVEPHGIVVRDTVEELVQSLTYLLNTDVDSQIKSQSEAQWMLVISSILALALGFGIAFTISSSIVSALIPVVERLKAIAGGDLSGARLEEKLLARSDEMGELATASQTMSDSLRKLLGEISGGIHTLSASATELSVVSKQTTAGTATMSDKANGVAVAAEEASANTQSIAAGMEQSSKSLSSVASATEEMSATVGDIAANTGRARSISERAVVQSADHHRSDAEVGAGGPGDWERDRNHHQYLRTDKLAGTERDHRSGACRLRRSNAGSPISLQCAARAIPLTNSMRP